MAVEKDRKYRKYINKKRLLTYAMHKHYVNNYKRTRPRTLHAKHRKEFLDIVSTFYRVIGEQLVEREGGVCIKELGYFFIWKIPKKIVYNMVLPEKGWDTKFNYHTNHVMYSPVFIANKKFRYWYMDKAFKQPLKKALKYKIIEGKKYKMYAHTLRQLKKYYYFS